MNPFLKDDAEEVSSESQGARVKGISFQKKTNVHKDSEAHKKAWAETLCTILDWTLALSVSKEFDLVSIDYTKHILRTCYL